MTGSNISRSDGRETRQELLLRRLADMLSEMRRDGVAGPLAFEALLARRLAARRPRE
jgi:hypothetical protein